MFSRWHAVLLIATAACAHSSSRLAAAKPTELRNGADRAPGRAPVPRGVPPRPPSPNNGTAALDYLKRDFLFYERLFTLAMRTAARAIDTTKRLLSRLLNFPPRVMVVSLCGVIAADDEVRVANLQAIEPDSLPLAMAPDGVFDSPPSAARTRSDVINLARCDKLLSRAFGAPGVRAVCLLLNSPGGSPVQSSLIYERLRALRQRHKRIPLLAFVEDSACSGGYYIACAADEIIADPNSIVGSIGVITRGFGYVKAIKKEGLTRRVHTAGDSKSGLDAFLPERTRDLRHQRRLLREIHTNFISAVKAGRGSRLNAEAAARVHHETQASGCLPRFLTRPSRSTVRELANMGVGLYDGSVYSGTVAVEVGLVDQLGEMRTELQRRFGRFVRIERVEPEPSIDYSRLLRFLF